MFCYQCEQSAKGQGCTKIGVCGKPDDVAALQDLLIYAVKGLSLVAAEGAKAGINRGDIIEEVEQQKVSSADDFFKAVKGKKGEVLIKTNRGGYIVVTDQ